MVELGLPSHLFLEFDGLYRPMNFPFAVSRASEPLNNVSPNTVVT